MASHDRDSEGLGDGQGTTIGAPAPAQSKGAPSSAGAADKGERAKDAPNAGRTRGAQESESTGAGSEATEGINSNDGGHDREHRSGYGGAGGKPVTSSDQREGRDG